MSKEIRVIIADDHALLRRGLRTMIDAEPFLSVVGEAENGEIALDLVRELKPDVVVLDLDMPVLDGLGTARRLRGNGVDVEIVFLTMHKEEALLDAVVELNVKGYILKDGALSEIVKCIKTVTSGRRFLSPELSELLQDRSQRLAEFSRQLPGVDALTPSERRILRLLAESKTSAQIAEQLFVSVRTVENHRANMATKLGLKGSHALLTFALENRGKV